MSSICLIRLNASLAKTLTMCGLSRTPNAGKNKHSSTASEASSHDKTLGVCKEDLKLLFTRFSEMLAHVPGLTESIELRKLMNDALSPSL